MQKGLRTGRQSPKGKKEGKKRVKSLVMWKTLPGTLCYALLLSAGYKMNLGT